MKKLIASVLSAAIACSSMCVAMAADANVSNDSPVVISANQEIYGAKTTYTGIVKEITDGQITLNDVSIVFNIDDSTFISDFSLTPYDALKPDDEVIVVSNTATTRSNPPQSYASYILVKTDDAEIAPIFATVESNNGEEIMSDDGQNRIIISDSTEVVANKIKIALKAKDITVGSEIFVFANQVGLSLPAYVVPEKIVVMKLADENADENETISQDNRSSDTSSYTITVNGDMNVSTSELPYSAYQDGTSIMVPLRKISEALGYTVKWNENSGQITIISDNHIAELYSKNDVISLTDKRLSSVNTTEIKLDKAPVIHEGNTYVPLSFFTNFDNITSVDNNSITITSEN